MVNKSPRNIVSFVFNPSNNLSEVVLMHLLPVIQQRASRTKSFNVKAHYGNYGNHSCWSLPVCQVTAHTMFYPDAHLDVLSAEGKAEKAFTFVCSVSKISTEPVDRF